MMNAENALKRPAEMSSEELEAGEFSLSVLWVVKLSPFFCFLLFLHLFLFDSALFSFPEFEMFLNFGSSPLIFRLFCALSLLVFLLMHCFEILSCCFLLSFFAACVVPHVLSSNFER
jgi:hypothetical protein